MKAAARRKFMLPLKVIIPHNPSITSNCNDQTTQKKALHEFCTVTLAYNLICPLYLSSFTHPNNQNTGKGFKQQSYAVQQYYLHLHS
jgi:hypothetical protein